MAFYLGFDLSTQSLTAVVIETTTRAVVTQVSVSFQKEPALQKYGCGKGYLKHDDDLVRCADPLVWIEAVDVLLQKGKAVGFNWSLIDGVSGSGQQHGSVYLNDLWGGKRWDPKKSLAVQIEPQFSRATAPVWMDSSTSQQCREITETAGGEKVVAQTTGSRATERFTGPQIRKFFQQQPAGYDRTKRIHLVSSFVASLLCGKDVGIDVGDGAGMNLLDLAAGDWSSKMLDATAPKLREKLPPAIASTEKVGQIAPYFVQKYGFREDCQISAFSGDNPNSLIGMGAIKPGAAVISLGTSDVYFACMEKPVVDPQGFGHVFGNGNDAFMSLICFKNGSYAREKVAEKVGFAKRKESADNLNSLEDDSPSRFDYDWKRFSQAILEHTEAGNGNDWMLPYFDSEITPRILEPQVKLFGTESFCNWTEPARAARAVVEAQAISMRIHSSWIPDPPKEIFVTGGGSQNDGVAQVLADVFGKPTQRREVANSAALGAALRAAINIGDLSPEELLPAFTGHVEDVFQPNPNVGAVYNELAQKFQQELLSQ